MPKHARKLQACQPRVKKKKKKEFRLDLNNFGFMRAGVSNVGG